MQVNEESLSVLLGIQQLDLEELRAIKRRDALPQRAEILALRKKKAEVESKREKVEPMRTELDDQLIKIATEDDSLATKQQATQEKIDNAGGDFRSIDALTRDLNGLAKRRVTLEGEINALSEKLDQVKAVQDQITAALNNIAAQEEAAIASFQKEGGAINEEISQISHHRHNLETSIDKELIDRYKESAKRNNGIGIAVLSERSCSACRNEFPEGKLLKARSDAPLATCPFCKRMLVVR